MERRYFSRYATIGSMIILTFIVAGTALAVRNGTAMSETTTYFMPVKGEIESGGSSSPSPLGATAAAVKYKRCLVTAGHVLDAGVDRVYAGADLRPGQVGNSTKRQMIARSGYAPGYTIGWTDFAVLWLEKKTSTFLGKQRMQEGDYSPQQLAKADGFGLTPITYSAAQAGGNSPGAAVDTFLAGYGQTIAWFDPPGAWSATDPGIKRSGWPRAMQFFYGSGATTPKPGSVIQTIRDSTDGRIGCVGDSGSPLRKTWDPNYYGVLSQPAGTGGGIWGAGAGCIDTWVNVFSAFDDTNTIGGRTNWQRITGLVETTCGKSVGANVIIGEGNISGSFSPQWQDPDGGLSYNGIINCDDSGGSNHDCGEFMHEGDSIDLTASPASGWKFKWWGETSSNCPCLPQSTTNPCSVAYDSMGYYDESISLDHAYCVAVFESSSSSFSMMSSSAASSVSSMIMSTSSSQASSQASSSAFSFSSTPSSSQASSSSFFSFPGTSSFSSASSFFSYGFSSSM